MANESKKELMLRHIETNGGRYIRNGVRYECLTYHFGTRKEVAAYWETSLVCPSELEILDGTEAIYNYSDEVKSLIIPPSVKFISKLHGKSGLEEVHFSEGLEKIGIRAFYEAPLRSIILPSTVKSIGLGAFGGCKCLREVTLPNGLELIDCMAFMLSAVESINIPSSVKSIKAYAFLGCSKLGEISLSEGLEKIGDEAFRGVALNEVTIPSTVKTIGKDAFDMWVRGIGVDEYTFDRIKSGRGVRLSTDLRHVLAARRRSKSNK